MKPNRLIAILLLLESRGNINANELAQALEVSKRTIHRDIEELCQAGVPIASSTGQSGGYYLLNGYTSNLKSLCTDEVITLYLSGIGIHPQKHTESGISLRNALTDYWHDSVEKFKNKFSSNPEYSVILKILNNDFKLPENFEIKENNESYITVNLYSFTNAANTVWELKNNVVVEPYDLKQYVQNMAEKILKNYT